MLTIVFYSTNGQAAKYRAREIAAVSKGDFSRCYDASSWDGTPDKCDAVEIMPDVSGWQRRRIKEVFGEIASDYEDVIIDPKFVDDHRRQLGLMPEKDAEEGEVVSETIEKKAVHRGGGRWFVMAGEEIISGPHDKAEAKRLVEEE